MILTSIVAVTYRVVIQYKQGGWKKWVLALPAALVWAFDVFVNYTEQAWIFGWPKKGDHTITARVRTMLADPDELPARRELARMAQVFLDAMEVDGKH